MTTQYEPRRIEEKWVAKWREAHIGRGDASSTKPKFSMVMPPPNVTGALHLGHTMMAAVEDTIVRYKKMTGHEVCWIPGIDHAGIATQSVVERQLALEGLDRHKLGREEFLKRTWQWKEEKGDRIMYQLTRLGCACDWEKLAFTMDPELSEAVVEAFVRMHERGLIYRDNRLVSWSPFLKTAISDIEVDTAEYDKPDRIRIPGYDKTVEVGMLWHFKYPLKRSVKIHYPCEAEGSSSACGADHTCGIPKIESDEWIEVATTRPETLFGDVAVAVNPKDPRYAAMVGQELYHPFAPERVMLVIPDDHCDPEFGTGAVKVTPAHDKNDYEIGVRHSLTPINILTLDGKINQHGGPHFEGMHRFQARVELERWLEQMGLFVGKEKNAKKMSIPICSRSGDIVEPMLLPQWYVKCDNMAARAIEACRDGSLQILPAGSEKQWYYWLNNIRDWCVSRQLWWGHRIPAYRVEHESIGATEEWVVARDLRAAEQKAKELLTTKYQVSSDALAITPPILHQDPDVLDTWFSSGLFPFSALRWPRATSPGAAGHEVFKKFFPTTLLETGSDILFFWVARMVMMSLELLDQLPFTQVYLHPMVRDAHGKKMSKSTGNVVDPIDVINGITLERLNEMILRSNIKESERKRALDAQQKDFPNGIEECGTDALRYGLLAYLTGGASVNLDINRVVAYRHFCNKIYNALRFTLMFLKPIRAELQAFAASRPGALSPHWADRWIRSRANECARATGAALEQYEFFEAVNATYSFILYEFCDVYLEISKVRLAEIATSGEIAAQTVSEDCLCCAYTLFQTFDTILHLVHPMMPFISEECWSILYEECGLPKAEEFLIKSQFPAYSPSLADATIDADVQRMMSVIREIRSMLAQFDVPPKAKLDAYLKSDGISEDKLAAIAALAKVAKVSLVTSLSAGWVVDTTREGDIVAVDPAGLIDFAKVVAKLSKKMATVEKALEGLRKKMSVPTYETKVPLDVREKNSESLVSYEEELRRLQAAAESAKAFLQ